MLLGLGVLPFSLLSFRLRPEAGLEPNFDENGPEMEVSRNPYLLFRFVGISSAVKFYTAHVVRTTLIL